MTKPHLVTRSDLKAARFPKTLAPIVAAAILALAVILTERAPDAPAPPVLPPAPASPRAFPSPSSSRKAQADYERAVDLYAEGRLKDSAAVFEKLADTPSAKRALTRIRAELASQKR